MKRLAVTFLAVAVVAAVAVCSQTEARDSVADAKSSAVTKKRSVPPVVHSQVGDTSVGVTGHLKITNIGKRRNFGYAKNDTHDSDIMSPKSASFSPDGKRLFVNSLEGCRTVVYDAASLNKIAVIHYDFEPGGRDSALFARPSGYYTFKHYPGGEKRRFGGKPVESAWSHGGRYLWVTFYRRTFDINAQESSAVAVVDTKSLGVVRVFETGPLPKMVAVSHNDKFVAVTHWGNNTVGFIDISSDNPADWHHRKPVVVGHQLELNLPLNRSVNRDANSGYLLRGTVFTPDDRYLLVSGMAGPLSVIDVEGGKHVGFVDNLYGIRHLAISNGYVYGTINISGQALRFRLDSLVVTADKALAGSSRHLKLTSPVKRIKVGGGARTLALSPDGKYVFVACNSASGVYVVDFEQGRVVDNIRCDSYPVGLAISPDGRLVAVTSQGRQGQGGNALNLFEVDRPDFKYEPVDTVAVDTVAVRPVIQCVKGKPSNDLPFWFILGGIACVAAIVLAISAIIRHRKRRRV